MVQAIISLVILIIALLFSIYLKMTRKIIQGDIPLILVSGGISLIGGGVLTSLNFGMILKIHTYFSDVLGYVKTRETDYVYIGIGLFLTVMGTILWISIKKRVYILNMIGKVKHEISDKKNILALRIKDYQLKETILDLRWIPNELSKSDWQKAKGQIEDYVHEFFARADAAQLGFTGMAPIPFEIYAGSCISDQRVPRFFEYNRSNDSYYELKEDGKKRKDKNRPAFQHNGNNKSTDDTEIVVAISITQRVLEKDLVQFSCPIYLVGLDSPADNIIVSMSQLSDYLDETCAILLNVREKYQNIIRINLVGAFPSCFAFDLGCRISHLDNRLPEIVAYHYVATGIPNHPWGIVVTGNLKGRCNCRT